MARGDRMNRPLGADDIHILRGFLKQACLPYLDAVTAFYDRIGEHDMSPGRHSLDAAGYPSGALGYMVFRRGRDDFKSTQVFAYINPVKLDLGLPGGSRLPIFEEILQEPLMLRGGLYAYFRKDKVCILTEEMHLHEMKGVRLQAVVYLTRAEACSILEGEAVVAARRKIMRAFGMTEEGNR